MAKKPVKVAAMGVYAGHAIKQNRIVELSFKLRYDQLTQAVLLTQMLNENVRILAKCPDESPTELGVFSVKNINIDHDGCSSLKFTSQLDYVEADELNGLANVERDIDIKLMFKANVEEE